DKGLSVNLMYNQYLGESKVLIDDRATAVGKTITVNANQDSDTIAVGLGLQRGGSVGAGASVVINEMHTQTIAKVAADVSATAANQMSAAPGLTLGLTANVLNRDAGDWLADGFRTGQLVAVTLADSSLQQLRIADVSADDLTFVETPVFATSVANVAVVGSLRTDAASANAAFININAKNEVDFFALAAAAAITGSVSAPDSDSAGGGSDSAPTSGSVKQSTGVGIAGSVAINTLNNTLLASATNTVLSSFGAISVTAENDVSAIAITGSASKSTGVSLAGAFSHNDITQDVQARIEHSQVYADDLALQAFSELRLINISAGGSFASGANAKIALYGSVNVNDINSTIKAELVASKVTLSGSLTIDAKLTSDIISFAGGAAVGGKAAIGAAVDVLNVLSNVDAAVKGSGSTQSVVDTIGEVKITATTDQSVMVGTVSLAASKEKLAASGSVTILNLDANTNALVSNALITTQGEAASNGLKGDLTLGATDTLNLIAFAGTIAASRGAALGGAYSGNRIKSDAQARLENASIVLQKGSVTLVAKTDLNLTSVAISGAVVAGSEGIGGALSGAIINNDIDTTTYATVSDSDIVKAKDVSLTVIDDSSISADAGGVALAVTQGPGGSIGVSVAINDLQSNLRAGVTNSSINASGDISISSKTIDSSIYVFALSGIEQW
ncbi:MAG: hypothetical protein MJK13_08505, partial [Pseudomonadales bacterium]|nr:hypothetical protein [Pseudomonadales bacterium]